MPSRMGNLLAVFRPTNLLALVLLGAVGYAAYTAWRIHMGSVREEQARRDLEQAVGKLQEQNAALTDTVRDLEARNAELQTFVARLTTESRVADVVVVAQERDAGGQPVTTLELTELDRAGRPLPPQVLTARGDEVYFDALLVKFMEDDVKLGDPLRGKSLHLFRRVFGSAQEPRNGQPIGLSSEGGIPDVYRVSPQPSDFERRVWRLFWRWADHPDEARQDGVRVAQIEAVAIRPEVGARYRLTLEHDGGLSITKVR